QMLLMCTAVSTAAACKGGGQAAAPAGAGRGGGPPAVPVGVAVIQTSPVDETSEYIATLKALQSTSVHPQVEGYIVRISVKSGDRVTPGTPMVQIDQARQQAALAVQEADVKAREADVAYARQQFDRLKDLYGQKVVSK